MTIKVYHKEERALLRMIQASAFEVAKKGHYPFHDPDWEDHRDLHVADELGRYGAFLVSMLDGERTTKVRLCDAAVFPDLESLVHFRMVWG